MKVNIHQTISNVLDENREIISTITSETFVIYPEEGKLLRNKITGLTTDGFIAIGSKDSIDNYEEVDKEVR